MVTTKPLAPSTFYLIKDSPQIQVLIFNLANDTRTMKFDNFIVLVSTKNVKEPSSIGPSITFEELNHILNFRFHTLKPQSENKCKHVFVSGL